MIFVHGIGRRSNGMIQYAFGRILAETIGCEASFRNINTDLLTKYGLPVEYGEHRFEGQEDFPGATPLSSERPETGHEWWVNDYTIQSIAREDGWERVIEVLSTSRPDIYSYEYDVEWPRIILHGFFQNGLMFREHIPKLRKWFAVPKWGEGPGDRVLESDWCFHLRHEDYDADTRLPLSYYMRVIRENGIRSFDFVGKDLDTHYVSELINAGGTYHDKGSSINDWRFFKDHKKIVCANSSWSGIGAWLSRAERIILPVPQSGYWSRRNDQQFYIPGTAMEEMEL